MEMYKWHDIRKNPNDLPPFNKNVLFVTEDGSVQEGVITHYANMEVAWKQFRWNTKREHSEVIAWKYIEPYKGSD